MENRRKMADSPEVDVRKAQESDTRTPWAVNCPVHGLIFLTEAGYIVQLSNANARWICPRCNRTSIFDDTNYEYFSEQEGR